MIDHQFVGAYKRARNSAFLEFVQDFRKYPFTDPARVSRISVDIDALSRAELSRLTGIDPGPVECWEDPSNSGSRDHGLRCVQYLGKLRRLGVAWSDGEWLVLRDIFSDADGLGFAKFDIGEVAERLACSRDLVLDALATLSDFDPDDVGERHDDPHYQGQIGRDCGPWKGGQCYQVFIPMAFGSVTEQRQKERNAREFPHLTGAAAILGERETSSDPAGAAREPTRGQGSGGGGAFDARARARELVPTLAGEARLTPNEATVLAFMVEAYGERAPVRLGVRPIAEQTGLDRNAVQRSLQSMASIGAVYKAEGGGWLVNLRVLEGRRNGGTG